MAGALIRANEKKNVFFMQMLGGDEELPDVNFKKHYRLGIPVITDNLDRYRHIIRVRGISNVAIFGGDGVCVLNREGMGDDFQAQIDAALAKIKGPNRKPKAFVDGGTVYAPQVKEAGLIVRERMPRLAAGPDGELHLVFFSDARGSNDVILRSYKDGKWGKEVQVAATKADEYSPVVAAVGKGAALVAFVSNEGGPCYDIYTVLVKDGTPQKRVRVTQSRDDAMAPSLWADQKNDPWLAWYEWAKMGNLSRDREVLAARLKGGNWSKPIQVSPREVPQYEDHADPDIVGDGKGGAWVAWAWDYHGTLASKPPVAENSIFCRRLESSMKLGEILAAGFRGGEDRARDYAPSLALGEDGLPRVAWDNSHKASLGPNAKAIFVNRLAGKDFDAQVEAAASAEPIDSPRLLRDAKGGLHLLWNQQTRAGWEVKLRTVEPAAAGSAQTLALKGKKPRYPSGCFDSQGRLWVAYSDTASNPWKVAAEMIEAVAKAK